MRQECGGEVVTHAAKEEEEEEQPLEVADERAAEAVLLQSILEDCGRDVGQATEDDYAGEEDLPRLEVEKVQRVA